MPVLAVLAALLMFGSGFLLGRSKTGMTEKGSGNAAAGQPSYTAEFYLDGSCVLSADLPEGSPVQLPELNATDSERILFWKDELGTDYSPEELSTFVPVSDKSFTAQALPKFSSEGGYFPCKGGFFRPDAPLTRAEAATILYTAMANKPHSEEVPADLADSSEERSAITAMVNKGYLPLVDGYFLPDDVLTEGNAAEFLSGCFPAEQTERAMAAVKGYGSETLTHAEAAVLFNSLFGVSNDEEAVYLPDVAADDYFARDIFAAAKGNGPDSPLSEGFFNVDGYLYHLDADGRLTRNTYIGSLYFDFAGRYTSGSRELDDAVAAAIRESVDPDAPAEEQLKAAYAHARDSYSYLKGNMYNMGDSTWALDEAIKIYTTGMGNCYSYAAGFWAIARGLGYEAMVVSGTVGKEASPHGWVEIPMDGGRYLFDVELEMAYKRDNRGNINMYKLEEVSARYSWLYNKNANANLSTPGRIIAAQ